MKNYKYIIGLLLLSITIFSCDVDNSLEEISKEAEEKVELNINGLDFSKYVAVGASFTAGFTDNALFIAAQENSFPNILAKKFGTENFKQPLMNDNIGGLTLNGSVIQGPRLYFDGKGPATLDATPTTELTKILTGGFNNYGIPGAKSFHFAVPGYGNISGVPTGLANAYFVRMASSADASVIGDAMAQKPTFFTLSEIGGNDVLGYALAGGDDKIDQITPTATFKLSFESLVKTLTENNVKGVIANVPYITSLAHFTTVSYNPVPLDEATVTAANNAYKTYNDGIKQAFQVLVARGEISKEKGDAEVIKRTIKFTVGQNAVVILDEDLIDLTGINSALTNMRQTTSDDLLVLSSSSLIGTLADPNNPLSVNGVGVALADKWVITPEEQTAIKTATDSYNSTIKNVADTNNNVALVDFKSVLEEASTKGITFDKYTMTTSLVTGGLISLDGVHLTARGYALMANKILEAIDNKFGSNFTKATGGLVKAADYPTNYSSSLR